MASTKIVPEDEGKANIGRSSDFSDAISMRVFFDLQTAAIEFATGFF